MKLYVRVILILFKNYNEIYEVKSISGRCYRRVYNKCNTKRTFSYAITINIIV